MKRWLWYLQRLLVCLGIPGMAGMAMILAAVLLHLGLLRPAAQELQEMRMQLANLREQPAAPQQDGVQQRLTRFYAFFPQQQSLSQQVRTVHEVTQRRQLYMGRIDYKLSRVSGLPLQRYGISYALAADYPTLRVYLAELLHTLPNAALEDIQLQRSSDDAQMLEAKIDLALYYREPS